MALKQTAKAPEPKPADEAVSAQVEPHGKGKAKMKVQDLLFALNSVKPGLATKDVIEQATHFVFTGSEVATWNDRVCVSHKLDTPFYCSVVAEDLMAILRGMKEGDIEEMYLSPENQLVIQSSYTAARLSTMVSERRVEEALASMKLDELEWKPIPQRFLSGLKLCQFSASADHTTQNLFCVYVEGMDILSSDGDRCSIYNMDEVMPEMLIPASTIKDLTGYNVTHYCVSDNWLHCKTAENATFSVKLGSGEFHDIRQYFEVEGEVAPLPIEVKDAVDSATAMCEADSVKDLKLSVIITKDLVTIHAEKERGDITKKVPCKYDGPSLNFLVNPVFFSEVIGLSTEMTVGDGVCLFQSDNFRHVISLPVA